MVAEGFTWRDASGRSLTLSGQVNPAFNVVDDGVSTDVFIVDNDTSGTRFRLDADAPLGETSLGATIEIGASPNNSYDVSQLVSQTDADFNVRRAEVTFRNDRYGRLQLGKGSGAADDTAEYDLSLVAGPIMYAGVADIAGGIIFTDGTDYSDTDGAATPSSTSTATGWRASATTARCSVPSRARSPTARTTSGRPRSPSGATTATGAAGPWAISPCLPPPRSTTPRTTTWTTPTPPRPRSCTIRPASA